jgi:hypothetical protein
MSADPVLASGRILNALPGKSTDSETSEGVMRLNAYRELALREQGQFGYAEEGSLYVATNPTISTGMLWVAAQTAYSNTAINFHLRNTEVAGGKSARLQSLKLIATAAATSTTAVHYAVSLDPVARTLSTDNTTTIVPKNCNGAFSDTCPVVVNAQNSASVSALTAASAGNRILARGVMGGLNIVGEEFFLMFGAQVGGSMTPTAVDAAGQPGRRVSVAPAVIVPPGASCSIHIWSVAAAASMAPEFELLFAVK